MRTHLIASIAAGLFLFGSSAFAHHPFSAEYDANKPAQVEGRVTKVDWANPHSFLTIEGRDGKGNKEHFKVELGSPHALGEKGWKKRDVRVGDEVTVNGWYGRSDKDHINAQFVRVHHNGKQYDAASSYSSAAGN